MADLYTLFGLERTASQDAIKSKYHKLVLDCHPDKNPNNPEAEEWFKAISAAYCVLKDPQKRRIYNSKLKISRNLFEANHEDNSGERDFYWQEILKNRREFKESNFSKVNNDRPFVQNYRNKEARKEALRKEALEASLLEIHSQLRRKKYSLKGPTDDLHNSLLTLLASPLIYGGLEYFTSSDPVDDSFVFGLPLILGSLGALGTVIYSSIKRKIKHQIEDLETNMETLEEMIKHSS